MILHSEIGRIDLVTLALPQFVKVPTAVYTSTGSVFVDYGLSPLCRHERQRERFP